MGRTGRTFVTLALRELQILDPTATASGERLADGLEAATDLLDTWRVEKLLVSGTTISTYSLSSGVQTYTIGPGATFAQAYPASIERWSVIPDDDAADLVEIPMGRPFTSQEWQQIRVKSSRGSYPRVLFVDDSYDANGRGNVSVYPIPDNGDVDIKLYQRIPAITSLAADTTYQFAPGGQRAFQLALAIEIKDRYGKAAVVSAGLEKRATHAVASFKRHNMRPQPSRMRSEFIIGNGVGRRTHNIYTDS